MFPIFPCFYHWKNPIVPSIVYNASVYYPPFLFETNIFTVSLLRYFQNREGCATWRTCLVCPSINVSRNSFVLSRNSIRIVRSNYCVFIIITKAIYNNFCKYLQIVAKWFSVIPHENLYNIEDVKDILRCGKCYPECNTVNYNAKISIADLESNQHVAELL